ncbi:hypothetical protein DSO57_1014609 [Entomophthora muscae]|uniref:Uncharacterized protein n=1 Tax=Entomophthora muscae TaxID=34485 RepID=A0ACC2URP3_9FUNG|nr:hypothetical protein DSO57_1014609 [Entomophthora muscae]
MQAKYKLLASHLPLLGNDNSSKLVPGYDPGHILGTGDQEPHIRATPHQETFLPIPSGVITKGYVIYQEQLVAWKGPTLSVGSTPQKPASAFEKYLNPCGLPLLLSVSQGLLRYGSPTGPVRNTKLLGPTSGILSGIQSWEDNPLFSGITQAGFCAGKAHYKRGANLKR